ncbi:hypothetical protein P9239_17950 [Caballeronia sp. LZ062]|uniref:hypothetical protein n=1 Tax=unclassified Caballeronia TaxID=2646786 RepID=UPI00285A474B|nr:MULTISPECIES: hypothetical protein [unclassified Caballeronia]MDR5855983.1 hypothetical protein [Caballeronia sp. LZ050]MDR5872231.1 hypothetical protein [Caballeronia sp. LZ062]
MSDEKTMRDEQLGSDGRSEKSHDGWDALLADDKERKETILEEHFRKAFERFEAGVSLARIRVNYEKLGAKYSPATFRKKWNELVARHTEQV